jgi:membrane associated rhomboid family serine protease
MFPLYDENPNVHPPYAVMVIIGVNIFVWFVVQGFGSDPALAKSMCQFALIPGDLLSNVVPGTNMPVSQTLACQLNGQGEVKTLFSSMFMHGGWLHIIGNMWFLWVFGDNVEDIMGPGRFVIFYLLCGLAAAAAQIATNPDSLVPMVGASGAIGGVMGAYALLYPKTRVQTVIFLGFFVTTFAVPAFVMLGYWFVLQLLQGVPAIGRSGGGTAFWAHIGGFVAGLALVLLFRDRRLMAEHSAAPKLGSPKERWF